ncbi:matrixin family metalloprotease [Candidatus Gottesmanbacteria bacterium]|nr:matrixin family metalloprotease [Candidatus Gottesmanbacteria bacterium]
MKRFFVIFCLAVLFLTGVYGWKYLTTPISPCDTPIDYRLGELDPRFNLTAGQAEKDIVQATEIWNQTAGKKVFQENPQAKLTVNFVYDERQALSSKIGSLENNLNLDKKTLDNQVNDFLQQKTDFETKLAALNKEISSWNQKGGVFDGAAKTIYIYLNPSRQVLIHTLAHEFGHALGINHVNNSQAIMYPYTGNSLTLTLSDKNEISQVCQPVPRWQMLLDKKWQKML